MTDAQAPAPVTEEQVQAAIHILQVYALGCGPGDKMKPFTREQGESLSTLIKTLWGQKRVVQIDMAGAMEKITPQMMDAAKDAMIEGLTKGGKAWMERAIAAEAVLQPFQEVFAKVMATGIDTESELYAPVRFHHLRAANARLENAAKGTGGDDAPKV